ncbi:MAG: xanthine dehydrogenase, partial [Oscillospiraceae bacterium]|nr:xanthine dehydrogenase [Oscillospiraceae bacterium]
MHIDPMNIIGKGIPVQDAVMKVTGRMEYLDDMNLPRMLCGKVLFSPKAHARIVNIDTSAAEAMPGVKAVVCYKNTPDAFFNSNGEDIDILKTEKLFDSVVRHVGDRVAAVAAVDEKTALAAIRAIRVEYEDLPAVFDAEEAAKEGAYPIHEGGNVLCEVKQACGDVEAAFASAQHVISRRYELSPI